MDEKTKPPASESDAPQRASSTATQDVESKDFFFAIDPHNFQLVEWSSSLPRIVRIPENQLASLALSDLVDESIVRVVRDFISTQTIYAYADVHGETVFTSPQPTFELRLRSMLLPCSVPCVLTKITPLNHQKLRLHLEAVESRSPDDATAFLKSLAECAEQLNASALSSTLEDLLNVAQEAFGKLLNVEQVATWQKEGATLVLTNCSPPLFDRIKHARVEFKVSDERSFCSLVKQQRLEVVNCYHDPIWTARECFDPPANTDLMKRIGARACIVLSICHRGILWGMVAGYSDLPRCLTAAEQAAGDTFAGILNLHVSAKIDAMAQAELSTRLETVARAAAVIDDAPSFCSGVQAAQELLMQSMRARGVAYVEHQQVYCFRENPGESEIRSYIKDRYNRDQTVAESSVALTSESNLVHPNPVCIELDSCDKGLLLFYPSAPSGLSDEGDELVAAKLGELLRNNRQSRLARDVHSELQRLNEDLNTFAYSVSHDLRAPLRAATQALFFLEKSIPDPPADAIVLRLAQLKQAHNHLSELIDAVLRLSRVDRMGLRIEKTKLSEVIAQAAEVSLGYHPRERTSLKVETSASVYADFVALRDVFVNLFSNALRYNRSGHKEIAIGTCLIESGIAPQSEIGRTAIFCRDNGIGIASEHHQEIFDLFRRFSPSDLIVTDGTGAGLAIVKRIVERHGGKIWIESEVGRGTTIYFTLGDSMP